MGYSQQVLDMLQQTVSGQIDNFGIFPLRLTLFWRRCGIFRGLG